MMQSRSFHQNETRASSLMALVPFWFVLRSFLDGNTGEIFGLKFTEVLGLLLFGISIILVVKTAISGYPFLILVPVFILLSTIQGFYNWGQESFQEATRIIGILGLVLLAWRRGQKKDLERFLGGLKLLCFTNGFLIICQFAFLGGGTFVSGVTRYKGFMFNANTAAILFCCYLLSEANKLHSGKKFFTLLSVMLSLIGLFLTFSLGGFLFLLTGIYLTMVIFNDRKFQGFLRLFLALAVSSFITISSSPGLRSKYFSSIVPLLNGDADGRSSVQWRFDAWRSFLPYFTDSPLVGQGFGSTLNLNMAGRYLPHNELIRFLVEVGLLGTSIFIALYIALIVQLRNIWKESNSPITRYALVIACTWAISSTSENSFTYTVPQYILALSIGFSFSMRNKQYLDSYKPSARRNRLINSEVSFVPVRP